MIVVVRGDSPDPSEHLTATFTGEVWRDTILPERDGVAMANVHFAPGARSHWHTHEGGQLLLVLAGEGRVGDDSGPVEIRPGDTVWTAPGVRHWHGASPDRYLLHTTVSLQGVDWHGPVSDEDYQQAPSEGRAENGGRATLADG